MKAESAEIKFTEGDIRTHTLSEPCRHPGGIISNTHGVQ